MKYTKLFALSTLLLLLFYQDCPGQQYRRLALRAGIGNHQVGFPFTQLFASSNPAFVLGGEFQYNKSSKHQVVQTLDLRLVANDELGNSIGLGTNVLYRHRMFNHFMLGFGLGFGIVGQKSPNEAYQMDENQNYQKINAATSQGLFVQLPFSLGYVLPQGMPILIGLEYHPYIQAPYYDATSFPIMPQSIIQFNITYKFKK